jgi:hypothetical protein
MKTLENVLNLAAVAARTCSSRQSVSADEDVRATADREALLFEGVTP